MENLTYKTIFNDYEPQEEGDFFLQYNLKEGCFIVYSPGKGKLSCIEMINFTDIKPIELTVYLNQKVEKLVSKEEFSIPVTCDKATLLKYLFDIGYIDDKTNRYANNVKPFEGYILKDITGANRNFYQISEGKSSLIFDNNFTYVSNNNTKAEDIFLIFDPCQYERVLNDKETRESTHVLLLATGQILLFDKLLDPEKNLHLLIGNEDPINILKLFVFLLNKKNQNKIILEYDNMQVLLGFDVEEFITEDILNLMGTAQSKLREKYGERFKTSYQIKKTRQYVFINFRAAHILVFSLSMALYEMFNPNINVIK